MREKLLDLMKNEGLKSSQLAEMLEISPAVISHLLAGRNKPGFDLLQKILRRFPRINPDWLLLDSDRMYRDKPVVISERATTERTHQSTGPDDLFGTTAPDLHAPKTTGPEPAVAPQYSAHSNGPRTIRRVILLYEDQTFETYAPEEGARI